MSAIGQLQSHEFPPLARDLVLASTSPYRRALLERLGLPSDQSRRSATSRRSRQRNRTQSAWPRDWPTPRPPVCPAERIRRDVHRLRPGSVVATARVFGKPGTVDRAVEQLVSLAGQQHELITAMVVMSGPKTFRHTDVTKLWMRPLSRAAIERYVLADHPLDCAGSYKIESRGIALFERIESTDQTAITGLPLIALVSILSELGFEIP